MCVSGLGGLSTRLGRSSEFLALVESAVEWLVFVVRQDL